MHARLDPNNVLAVSRQLQHPHDVDAHALAGLDLSRAVAMRTILVNTPFERRSDPLPGHLDDAELRDLEDLSACPIPADRIAHGPLHVAAMLLLAHVDEIVDDHPPQIAEPKLPGDLLGGEQVHL